jgi:hypothetical protein
MRRAKEYLSLRRDTAAAAAASMGVSDAAAAKSVTAER